MLGRVSVGRSWQLGLVAVIAAVSISACGASGGSSSSAGSGGSVAIAMNTSLSGPFASIGLSNQNGVHFAVDQINASGGLLGKTINLEVKDDSTKPDVATELARNEILNDHIVMLVGGVSSSAALAEQTVIAKYKIPFIAQTSNTDALTVTKFNDYTFSVVTNTGMEGRANAIAAAKLPATKYYLLAPDYEFGHSQVKAFKAQLQKLRPDVQFVGEDYPKLGATDFSTYLNKVQAAHPDMVYSAQFGGDLITLLTQAKAAGVVGGAESPKFMGLFDVDTLRNLGGSAPAGAYAYSRAPYFAINTSVMTKFVSDFKAKYNVAPSDWAVNAYDAVTLWAAGVRKANSFDGTAVSNAMSGLTFDAVRGSLTVRTIDHQVACPEYEGTLAPDSNAGFDTFAATAVAVPGDQIILTPDEVTAARSAA